MFSTLTMNSVSTTTYRTQNISLSMSNAIDEKQLSSNYKFGVDGNLGYASLIDTKFHEIKMEKVQNQEVDKVKQIYSKMISNKSKVENKKNEVIDYKNKTENKVAKKDAPVKKVNRKMSHNKDIKEIKKEVKNNDNVKQKAKETPSKVIQQTPTPKKEKVVEKPKSIDLPKSNTITVNGVTYAIKKTISGGNATAYSSAAGGFTTSTGCKVFTSSDCCCVAVDPTQIPYYSDLLIEFNDGRIIKGKALDTGSALRKHYKGVVVDIYMNTERECNNFGRQPVTVHIV